MKKFLFLSLTLLSCQTGHGALSGFYQGMKEMQEILASDYLRSHLPQGYPIDEIKLIDSTNEGRTYALSANGQVVLAKLTYFVTPRLCGPRQYTIEWDVLN